MFVWVGCPYSIVSRYKIGEFVVLGFKIWIVFETEYGYLSVCVGEGAL